MDSTEGLETIDLACDEGGLLRQFKRLYQQKLQEEKQGFFGRFRKSNIRLRYIHSLEDVFVHALYHGGNRSLSIIQELGWIDDDLRVNEKIEALHSPMKKAIEKEQTNRLLSLAF